MSFGFKIFRTVLLILFLLATGFILPRLTFDDSLQNWVPKDSAIITQYRTFLKRFKSDALILVSVVNSTKEPAESFSKTVDSLIERISKIENVRTVMRWPPPFLRYKISPTPNIQSFFLTYLPIDYANPNRPKLIRKVENCLDKTGVNDHIAGTGVIHKAINEMTRRAVKRFLLVGLILLFFFLFLLTRQYQIILKTLGISLGGVGFVLLTAYFADIQFNLMMSVLPILILFYSTSVSVHILNHGGNIKRVFWPTVTAVLTTCAGFATFFLESAPLLRDFGLLAIAGLLGGFFWAVLLFYPEKNRSQTEMPYRDTYLKIKKFWTPLSFFVGIVLMIFLLPGALRIRSEINPLSLLPRKNRAIQDYFFVEKHVSPYMPIEYVVPLDRVDDRKLMAWIEDVYALPEVGAVMSYLAIPPWINAQKLGYVSQDGRAGRVTFFVPMMSTRAGLALVRQIDHLTQKRFSTLRDISDPTGFVALYVSVADHLAKSFRKNLILAFTFVFLIILIYLRNAKLFLASLLPNLFPIVALLGVMGWAHIPLDMVTMPIGCMVMGIIVDDTIHFLYWYRKTADVSLAFEKSGTGIVTTSLIYVLGFSVFLFAEALPVRYFGILSITAILTALFGDIVILPILLQGDWGLKKAIRRIL